MSRPSPFRLVSRLLGRATIGRIARSAARQPARGKCLRVECLEPREMLSLGGILTEVLDQVRGAVAPQAVVLPGVPRDRFEWDNAPQRARWIATTGQPQFHTLHTRADVDWVKFTLTQQSNVVIQTNGRFGDTEMWLFGPDSSSNQIAYDNDGNGTFSRIERLDAESLGPGTYYVKVGEFGSDRAMAGYLIGVKATPLPPADAHETASGDFDNVPGGATPIVPDTGPQTHTIHVTSDVDWVTFELARQSEVIVETRGAAGDTRLWLFGADANADPIAFDDNSGMGNFSLILRTGAEKALAPGRYYLKVDEAGNDDVIARYTISVTTLLPGDVFLVEGADGLSLAIRWGESRQLGVALADTYSHAAIYLGDNQVAEMLATGYATTLLPAAYTHWSLADIFRRTGLDETARAAVVTAAAGYAGTPYAYSQFAVLALAAVRPDPARVASSPMYQRYLARDAGPRKMICSELVARVFADANADLDVTLWPTIQGLGNASDDFRMDFTTPTVLSLSPSLQRLNV